MCPAMWKLARTPAATSVGSPVVRAGANQLDRGARVLLRVERQRRLVPRQPLAVPVLGLLLLQTRRVRQQQLQKVGRPLRAEDRPAEPQPHQPRQIRRVVDVRVRDDDRVQTRRVERRVFPIPLPQLPQPLKQPAIDQHPATLTFHQVLRPRHRPHPAPETQFRHLTSLQISMPIDHARLSKNETGSAVGQRLMRYSIRVAFQLH